MIYPEKYCTALNKYICLILSLVVLLFVAMEVFVINGKREKAEVTYKQWYPTNAKRGGTEFKITTSLGEFGLNGTFYNALLEGDTIQVVSSYFLNKPKLIYYSSTSGTFREHPMVFSNPFFIVIVIMLLLAVLVSLFKKGFTISSYFEDYYSILTISLVVLFFFFITIYA